ncbi:peptidase C14 [Nostoc sp. RF31YmG]|nr:peptidase C14 [Nostoc sp. RF31YmG]
MNNLFAHGYAVIIGVGADLPVTVKDATAIANLLCDPTRCAYPIEQVQLLTDEKARRRDILAALDTLAEQTSKDSDATAIVYFSGHGLAVPDAHLMPFGYNLADLSSTAISGDLFTEKLRAIRAKKLLILLDCCYAARQADAKAPTIPPTVIAQLTQSSGRVVIASSRTDEVSYTGNPYSVFTSALLEGFAGYGAFEQDGLARVMDIALYVGRMVPERTQDKQHPIIKVANLEDNFALAYYAAGATPIKKLDWSFQAPSTLRDPNTPQIATWRQMLANKRESLLLIEERISEYVIYQDVPLQLIKAKRQTEQEITELEQKIKFH